MTQTKNKITIKHQSHTKNLSKSFPRDGFQNGNKHKIYCIELL
jgi:hypothetical protein